MKVLILGGAGFIGSHLADTLVAAGHEITILYQTTTSLANISKILDSVELIEGDFCNVDLITKAVQGKDIIVHLIGPTLPRNSFADPSNDIKKNIFPSLALFECCAKAGVKKIVFASSGGTVYGVPQRVPIDEAHPINPITPYGISKLTLEKYLGLYYHHYGLDYTVLRLANPFGARQSPFGGQGVIAAWIRNALRKKAIEIWGDGSIVRDYVYIEDVVKAIELSMLTQTDTKVFNVGSGIGTSLLELHQRLEAQARSSIPIEFKNSIRADVPINFLDCSLINKTLGWSPKILIEEGIKRTWDSIVLSEPELLM